MGFERVAWHANTRPAMATAPTAPTTTRRFNWSGDIGPLGWKPSCCDWASVRCSAPRAVLRHGRSDTTAPRSVGTLLELASGGPEWRCQGSPYAWTHWSVTRTVADHDLSSTQLNPEP